MAGARKRQQSKLSDNNREAIGETLRKTVAREQKRLRKRQLLFILIAAVILFWLVFFLLIQ
ncbi:MAG: hypothetical protein R3301_02705 [Saprospiraceae bacterium]|nr:hypothetical protein [Saprospiraceae bacterium]